MADETDERELEIAAEMLKALADPHRLRVLTRLTRGEMNVTQLAETEKEKITTMSARLKLLLTARLVKRRRQGQTIFYSIADTHVLDLVDNLIEHAREASQTEVTPRMKASYMSEIHANHPHKHGPGCGHIAIKHGDHVDYLHDGHLHHQRGDVVEDHAIEVSAKNPNRCTPEFGHTGHEANHVHGPRCGHQAVPHADHVDYLVDGRLHHSHGNHCDDHGPVETV
ncbi:MAG: helix-turn-helix transcriptional regulator [Methylobacteriaceae bacterium]|nr:helix-turn-helix transcriptional regulator [Methylobacteriaceae bacterium]